MDEHLSNILQIEMGGFMKFWKKMFAILAIVEIAGYAEAKKILVVYFSHSDNTKLVAEKIREELNGDEVDVQRIETKKSYPENDTELRNLATKESEDKDFRPELKHIDTDVKNYDLILVGSPVWFYKAAPAVTAYLEKQDFTDKEVRFFITHGGYPGSCIDGMKNKCVGAKFGADLVIYCNSHGNAQVDFSKIGPWVKTITTEIK